MNRIIIVTLAAILAFAWIGVDLCQATGPVSAGDYLSSSRHDMRIRKLAEQRVLEHVRSGPVVCDGPEAAIGESKVVDKDHVLVVVNFVSGWGHVPLPDLTRRFIYTVSSDRVDLAGS